MEKNKKPIENIKEDLQSVIFKVELLHKDIIDLKKYDNDISPIRHSNSLHNKYKKNLNN